MVLDLAICQYIGNKFNVNNQINVEKDQNFSWKGAGEMKGDIVRSIGETPLGTTILVLEYVLKFQYQMLTTH